MSGASIRIPSEARAINSIMKPNSKIGKYSSSLNAIFPNNNANNKNISDACCDRENLSLLKAPTLKISMNQQTSRQKENENKFTPSTSPKQSNHRMQISEASQNTEAKQRGNKSPKNERLRRNDSIESALRKAHEKDLLLALYDYIPRTSNELSFKEKDQLLLIKK